MSRYTGPRLRVMRSLGVELPGLSRKSIERRPHPPGQHGQRRRKRSDYGNQLIEKQKLRYHYGLTERQLRTVVRTAMESSGVTGAKLVELLERRLDNLVFRAGLAPTIVAARQLVRHGHIGVNGRRVDIPSARLRVGDRFALISKMAKSPLVTDSVGRFGSQRPVWLQLSDSDQSVQLTALPDETSVPFPIELRQVIEYYSR